MKTNTRSYGPDSEFNEDLFYGPVKGIGLNSLVSRDESRRYQVEVDLLLLFQMDCQLPCFSLDTDSGYMDYLVCNRKKIFRLHLSTEKWNDWGFYLNMSCGSWLLLRVKKMLQQSGESCNWENEGLLPNFLIPITRFPYPTTVLCPQVKVPLLHLKTAFRWKPLCHESIILLGLLVLSGQGWCWDVWAQE